MVPHGSHSCLFYINISKTSISGFLETHESCKKFVSELVLALPKVDACDVMIMQIGQLKYHMLFFCGWDIINTM